MIQRVRLAVASVAKNRHDFDGRVNVTAKSTNKLIFASDLQLTCQLLLQLVSRFTYLLQTEKSIRFV